MTLDRVRDALEKLAKRGYVETLLDLNEVRRNPELAASPDYRRKFNGYYRMRQRPAEFYEHFFTVLQAVACAPSPPSLAEILQDLYHRTNRRELSFGSKLRATITDEVIFDQNVANYFGVPSKPFAAGQRLASEGASPTRPNR